MNTHLRLAKGHRHRCHAVRLHIFEDGQVFDPTFKYVYTPPKWGSYENKTGLINLC